jgi:hypothetical protein
MSLVPELSRLTQEDHKARLLKKPIKVKGKKDGMK